MSAANTPWPWQTLRYFDSAGEEFDTGGDRLAAWFVKEEGIRIQVGEYSVRWSDSENSWQLFVHLVVGSVSPSETWGYVESITLYREALATAKAKAKRQSAIDADRAVCEVAS